MVARMVRDHEAASSSLATSTKHKPPQGGFLLFKFRLWSARSSNIKQPFLICEERLVRFSLLKSFIYAFNFGSYDRDRKNARMRSNALSSIFMDDA